MSALALRRAESAQIATSTGNKSTCPSAAVKVSDTESEGACDSDTINAANWKSPSRNDCTDKDTVMVLQQRVVTANPLSNTVTRSMWEEEVTETAMQYTV